MAITPTYDERATQILQEVARDVNAAAAGRTADQVYADLIGRLRDALPGVNFRGSDELRRVADDIEAGTFGG